MNFVWAHKVNFYKRTS